MCVFLFNSALSFFGDLGRSKARRLFTITQGCGRSRCCFWIPVPFATSRAGEAGGRKFQTHQNYSLFVCFLPVVWLAVCHRSCFPFFTFMVRFLIWNLYFLCCYFFSYVCPFLFPSFRLSSVFVSVIIRVLVLLPSSLFLYVFMLCLCFPLLLAFSVSAYLAICLASSLRTCVLCVCLSV